MTAMFPTAAAAAVQQQESNVAQCDARIRQKGGPEEVMKVLSQELLKLHISKRSAIEEEIHGVHCNAVEETPQLIHDALVQLNERLLYAASHFDSPVSKTSLSPLSTTGDPTAEEAAAYEQ